MSRRAFYGFAVPLAAAAVVGLATPDVRAGASIDAWAVKKKVRIDGLLREWPGGFVRLRSVLRGRVTRGDPSVSGLIGYDAKNLFVAFKVRDDKLVRTPAMGRAEDHASVRLAFPRRTGGWSSYELRLYAGETGRSAAAVRIGRRTVRGARVVEAPMRGGYVVEARVPWSAFEEASRIRVGMKVALRYTDADGPGRIKAVVATTKASGGSMPAFRLEAEQGLQEELVRAQGLSPKPARRLVGNVAGDEMLEIIALYGRFLTIVGSAYRNGQEFYFKDLGVSDASAVRRLDLADFDGDGLSEIFVQKRVGSDEEYREVVSVIKVGRDDTPFTAFQHEVAVVTPEGEIRNRARLTKRGGRSVIEISRGRSRGFDVGSYDEPKPADMESVLYPWQSVGSRTYGWVGGGFEKIGEKKGSVARRGGGVAAGSGPAPPPAPRPPTADELLDRVYALYRKDRGVGKASPRFDFVTDVAGDRQTERVLVHGKDVVVFGRGFLGGTSYVFSTLGVERPEDIALVTARDLTGDGKAEVIVYGVRHTKTSEELGRVLVDRHVFLVYKVIGSTISRVFGAETGRAMGENKILGTVKFLPGRTGLTLELHPGRAVGWTQRTYPFPQDAGPAGGLEPLLTPWSGLPPRRYEFRGARYEQR